MKLMNSMIQSLYIALSSCCGTKKFLSSSCSSSFNGQHKFQIIHHHRRRYRHHKKSSSYYYSTSQIVMMPEGPEVRTVVDQLQGGVGQRLVDIQFLSGRYTRHGRPNGFEEFAKTMTPYFSYNNNNNNNNEANVVDTIQEWNAKGKFIYLRLDDGKNHHHLPRKDDDEHGADGDDEHGDSDDDDYCRSIWITLGMTGQFVNEKIHNQDPRFARWYLDLLDVETGSSHKVYYHDQRNFGTLKFCLSKDELDKKLMSIGPDVLDVEGTTVDDFLRVMSSVKDGTSSSMNICKFLMDQTKVSGVGNYILSEALYRSNIDPFASLNELDGT